MHLSPILYLGRKQGSDSGLRFQPATQTCDSDLQLRSQHLNTATHLELNVKRAEAHCKRHQHCRMLVNSFQAIYATLRPG